MRYAVAVVRFVVGFIIGDDWRITAGVLVALGAGMLLSWSVPPALAAVLTAALLAGSFAANLLIGARRATGRADTAAEQVPGGKHPTS
jgi:hypothetical protein